MPYSLAYADRFQRVNQPLKLENSFDCDNVQPFKPLSSGLNALRLNVTASEFKLLWSSALTGSELMFPEQSLTVQQILLNAADCIADNELGQDCIKYPAFSSLIAYAPQNPFTQADLTPAGYLKPPFSRWGEFESILPDWANQWLGGLVEWASGYQTNDILCDIGSLPIFANWLELLSNGLPRLEIAVSGEGKISLELLAIPLGGMAIISVDNPIDIGDVFASILDPNLRIIELNRDILSVPPETDVTHIEEIEILGLGNHTVYVQFVPVVDDSLIPVRFGGGLRSIELCGFDTFAETGQIMDIRLTNCGIEALIDGAWVEKISQAELEACFSSGAGITDIRWTNGGNVMETFINGAWVQETAWTIVNNRILGALSNASNALNSANLALTENDNQDLLISQLQDGQIVQDSRLSDLENSEITQSGQISDLDAQIDVLNASQNQQDLDIADLTLSVGQNSLLITDHENRIDALEQAGSATLTWETNYDFRNGGALGWSGLTTHVVGQGFPFGNGIGLVLGKPSINVFDSRVTMIEIEVSQSNVLADYFISFPESGNEGTARFSSGGFTLNWLQIPNYTAPYTPVLRIPNPPSVTVYLRRLRVLGSGGFNPFN